MDAGKCRRQVLDAYLDGRQDRMTCEVDEEACEHCQVQHEQLREGEKNSRRPGRLVNIRLDTEEHIAYSINTKVPDRGR